MGTYTGQDKRLQYLFQNGGGGGGGTDVEANPQGTPTAYLNTVKIANSIYSVEKPADIYSTEERQVGVFSDGKPLYQKTVNVGALPNNTTKNTAHNISNIDIIVHAFGFAKSTANHTPIPFVNNTTIGSQVALIVDNTNITLRTNDNRSNYSGYVTLQYTKTTDVAGSGIWTPQGSYAKHYSTSEQIIGTWLGKTLYSRVFDFGSDLNIVNNAFTNTIIDASNIQTLVDARGIYSSGATFYNVMANIGNGVIRLQSDRTNGGASVRYLYLEYTKITD